MVLSNDAIQPTHFENIKFQNICDVMDDIFLMKVSCLRLSLESFHRSDKCHMAHLTKFNWRLYRYY